MNFNNQAERDTDKHFRGLVIKQNNIMKGMKIR